MAKECRYCGTTENLTVDHIIPQSWANDPLWDITREPVDHPDNLVPACRSCNASKGARLPNDPELLAIATRLLGFDPLKIYEGLDEEPGEEFGALLAEMFGTPEEQEARDRDIYRSFGYTEAEVEEAIRDDKEAEAEDLASMVSGEWCLWDPGSRSPNRTDSERVLPKIARLV